MTERKPPQVRFEDWVERQIRTAQERGAFDDLPGAGKPIPNLDKPMTTAEWAVEWARREEADLTAALLLSLALRREREDLLALAAQQGSEAQVRSLVEGFNARLRAAYLRPADFNADDPRRVAESVRTMGLRYSTITGVARDDLPDGGAWLYAETVRQIHAMSPGTGVELLIPDFDADPAQLAEVFSSRPEVLAHNVETVPRIFKRIRPGFRFERSLSVITSAHQDGFVTKSNLILGMGETYEEVVEALQALHEAGTDLITITQYLRPSVRHHPVERWVRPEEFVALAGEAERIGFLGVLSGPLVRSSYRAGRLWAQAMTRRGDVIPEGLAHLAAAAPARQEASSLLPGPR